MIVIILSYMSAFAIGFAFLATHFVFNTKINGVDCSFCTVKTAEEKIGKQISGNEICIKFANDTQYKMLSKDIDLGLEDKQEIEKILHEKKITDLFKKKEYTLKNSFSFDEEKLNQYLKSLPEFKQEAVSAKNAYLNFDEKTHAIDIVPETIGNVKDIKEAFEIAKVTLQSGELVIDFTVTPEITKENPELLETKNKINQVLKTTIHYQLKNGKIETLDWSNWIKKNKQGRWDIEIEKNIKNFTDSLAKKIRKINWNCTFKATDIGNIRLPLRSSLKEGLNVEEETKRIKQLLGTGKTYQIEPIYTQSTYQDALSNYLEIDLTRQKVWLYRNGKCIVSGKCVSGNVSGGHSTPTGMFYLDYKTTDTYLRGRNNDGSKYNSHVNFWMPFNGGIGLHDATWRSRFGGTIYRYNGSHGCINLPYSVAKKIYENINYKTLIIVYKS